jgi:hypothetical protein
MLWLRYVIKSLGGLIKPKLFYGPDIASYGIVQKDEV